MQGNQRDRSTWHPTAVREQGTPTSPKSKPCFTLVDCAGHCLGDLHGAISATWLCFLFFSSLLPLKWSKACKAENIKTFWTALLVCWPFQHHLFSKQLWSWPEVVSFETLSLLLLPFVRHVDHNSLSQHWFPWSSRLLENHASVLFFLLRGRKAALHHHFTQLWSARIPALDWS